MEWWQAIVLGLVEGLTEYLPVSSTGHLVLAQHWMGLRDVSTGADDAAANAYAIAIQAGAIVAVLGLYRARVAQILRGAGELIGVGPGDPGGRNLGFAVLAGFLPAAFFGLLFDEQIEELLFGLVPIAGAWLVGGIAILATSYWYHRRHGPWGGEDVSPGLDLEALGVRGALFIGLIQCTAMWPGTSRSLVTIVGGLWIGLSMAAAVEFSFLLGLVTLGAATAYKALSDGALMLEAYGPLTLFLGFLAAWVSALVSVKWMVAWLKRHGLAIFGWYRVALAALVYFLFL